VIPDGAAFKTVRAWISGGEAVSIGLQREFKDRYDIDIRQGYGLTEASPIVTWNMLERPNVFGSIGTPMPYNQVRLVDRSSNEATDKGPGEIMVKE
jgi:long-chain acyl-CoA synthetase